VPDSDGTALLGTAGNQWETLYAVNASVISSDGDKKDIDPTYDHGLDYLQKFNPISYKWKVGQPGSLRSNKTKYGFNARAILDDIKQGKIPDSDLIVEGDDGFIGMKPTNLIAPLVCAVQELKAMNEALAARINILENI